MDANVFKGHSTGSVSTSNVNLKGLALPDIVVKSINLPKILQYSSQKQMIYTLKGGREA